MVSTGCGLAPLALFVAGLTGCIMTQICAFAKRRGVTLTNLKVDTHLVWNEQKAGRVYETAPHSFEIDVTPASDDPFKDVIILIHAAQKGCRVEQTLGQANTITHRLMTADEFVQIE